MVYSNLAIFVALVALLHTGIVGMRLTAEEVVLLNDMVTSFPEILDLDASDVTEYLDQVRSTSKKRRQSYYKALPDGGAKQHGRCDEVFVSRPGEEIRWLQGRTNLTSGSTTLLLHISNSCEGCIDVIRKVDKLYVALRERGLNVIGIHSNSVGYSTADDDVQLQTILKENRISFPVASLSSKSGQPPLLRNGLVDFKRAKQIKTSKKGLFRWLYGDLDFVVPIAVIYKNCLALQENPSVGFSIMGLTGSVEKSKNELLWPVGSLQDSEEQEDRFVNTLMQFGIKEKELGVPLTDKEATQSEDDDEDDETSDDEFGTEAPLQGRRRRGRSSRAPDSDDDEL